MKWNTETTFRTELLIEDNKNTIQCPVCKKDNITGIKTDGQRTKNGCKDRPYNIKSCEHFIEYKTYKDFLSDGKTDIEIYFKKENDRFIHSK